MTLYRACGLVNEDFHLFDHIAPICSLLKIPLFIQCPQLFFRYNRLYPELDLSVNKWNFPYLLKNFEAIFYGFNPDPLFHEAKQEFIKQKPHSPLVHKDLKLIFCLHGCSDKRYVADESWQTKRLSEIDCALIYGNRMLDIFSDANCLDKLSRYAMTGNYRYNYFQKHADFFNHQIEKDVLSHFALKQPTILYAPSWDDPERSSSLESILHLLADNLPSCYNLIIKPHMYTFLPILGNNPNRWLNLFKEYDKKPNILVLHDYPLIYPLLNNIDIYLGDLSSVNYDCLIFDKPMFFINHLGKKVTDKDALIFQCGTVIEKENFTTIYQVIEKNLPLDREKFSAIRKKFYAYAFANNTENLSDIIEKSLGVKIISPR